MATARERAGSVEEARPAPRRSCSFGSDLASALEGASRGRQPPARLKYDEPDHADEPFAACRKVRLPRTESSSRPPSEGNVRAYRV
jgi:hypothetical protein